MTTPPAAGPAPCGALSRAIVEAARRGASRALRSGCADAVEDAAAGALAKLAALGGVPGGIERPAAFAAACGRNAAIDGRRRALRDHALRTRLAWAPRALSTREAMGLPPGWHPQEVVPQAQDALAALRTTLRRAPSPAVRTSGISPPDHRGAATTGRALRCESAPPFSVGRHRKSLVAREMAGSGDDA